MSPRRRPRFRRPARLLGVLLVPLMFAVACGGSGSSGATATTSGLPGVAVVDLATGDQVDLASYVPADRPVLVWMWAPF